MLTPLLWFVLIVALIPAALWLLKRSPIGGAAQGQGLRWVGTLPLSSTQRVVTVEVGRGEERRWLVLGVTPQSISLLHAMSPEGEPATPAASPPAAFGDWLARMKPGAGSDRVR
jgi:flagellar protein FliO/FliZ